MTKNVAVSETEDIHTDLCMYLFGNGFFIYFFLKISRIAKNLSIFNNFA